MAISISVPGQIPPPDLAPDGFFPPKFNPVVRDTLFSASAVASVFVDSEGGGTAEVIEQVTASFLGILDPAITITAGTSSVTISGKHTSVFQDLFTFVSVGASNLIEVPQIAVGAARLPTVSNMFDLKQDGELEKIKQFVITVTYHIPPAVNTKLTQEFTVPQTVENNLEAVRLLMADYNYNNYKGL